MIDKEKKQIVNSINCTSESCSYREDLKNEFSSLITTFNQVLRDPICLAFSTLQLMENRTPEITKSEYWCSLMNDMKDLIQRLDECDAYGQRKKIDPCEANLLSILEEGADSIHATLESCNTSFHILCDKISEQNMNNYICDPVKIKIAFMNIIQFLTNVMEETKNVTIHINANPKELCTNIDGNVYLILTFSGDGHPLSDDLLLSLFEPFPYSQKNQNGISLAVADQVIKAHGGHIHIITNENETLFTVQLPLVEQE